MMRKKTAQPTITARCLLLCMAVGFLASSFLLSCVSEKEPESVGPGVGDPLPWFTVTLNDGRTVTTSSLWGKHVLIELFNTSCPDCRESLPVVNEVYLRLCDDSAEGDTPSITPGDGELPQPTLREDYMVFAIAREETEESIESYWKANGLTLPYSAQPDRAVYELFATTGIPRLFIAGPDGKITATFGPDDTPTADQLIKLLEAN